MAAYIFADVVHECLGHGVTCLIMGGRVTLLTSVFFRSQPWSRLTDVGGPSANLVVGGLLWIALAYGRRWSAQTRFFLLIAMASNLFWGTGYLIYSGVANTGDWVSAIAGLRPLWFWRLVLTVLGIASYGYSIRVVGLNLRPFIAGVGTDGSRARRLLLIPYLTAGLAACAAALLFRSDPMTATTGAFRETFLTNAGLVVLSLWFYRLKPVSSSAPLVVTRKPSWILATTIAFVVFAAVLGRGLSFPT